MKNIWKTYVEVEQNGEGERDRQVDRQTVRLLFSE